MARATRRTRSNECRRCEAYCDRVIAPSTCVAAACPSLYTFDDPLSGGRYMGCLHKVFDCEIDVRLFAEAERTRAGFGTVKVTGGTRSCCDFSIERAFDDSGACVNRRFWDWPDEAPGAFRAFDLRDAL
jgi:hypothetical protein